MIDYGINIVAHDYGQARDFNLIMILSILASLSNVSVYPLFLSRHTDTSLSSIIYSHRPASTGHQSTGS